MEHQTSVLGAYIFSKKTSYIKERIEMKATIKLLTVAGFAGLSLAACGIAGSSSASPIVGTSSLGISTYGFNSTKTEFVLPHHLGLLPASELALAKANPTYAKGLANPNDWMQMPTQVGTKTVKMGFYIGLIGGLTGAEVGAGKSFVITLNNGELSLGKPVVHTTSVLINHISLNHVSPRSSVFTTSSSPQLVAPSSLEIEAAPAGMFTLSNGKLGAFCVPEPEAYIANNKVVNASNGLQSITAGPFTVFAAAGLVSNSSTPPKSGPIFYDKGTTSCGAFH